VQTNRGDWTRRVAVSSCILAAGSLALAILTWTWFLIWPSNTFGEVAGVMFVLFIFPLNVCAWFVGGPIALALGGYAAKRVRSGEGTIRDGELAAAGILLSRVSLWSGVHLLLLVRFFGL
jgi:hypothetical protein